MNIRKIISSIIIMLGFITVLDGCAVAPHGHYPPHSQVSLVYWYYYPNYGVYYHPVDHYYYYSIGGVWRRSTTLPSGWVIGTEPRVRLQLSGIPYTHNREHRRQYPPRRVISPGSRPGNADRHDNHRRPDYDDRRPGNSNGHRPDRDKKDDRNIFVPHLKDENKFNGRPDDERNQKYKNSKKSKNKGDTRNSQKRYEKEQSSHRKAKGKPGAQEKRNRDRYEKDKGDRKENRKDRDEDDNEDSTRGNSDNEAGGRYKSLMK